MRSPWNGGSISLRRREVLVALLQEQRAGPSSGSSIKFRPGAIVLTRSAANSALSEAGRR